MGGIWAIARHTLSESLRTKFAIVTLVLEILALATFPFILTGDGTLAGRIRTYLAYSMSITIALLTICTIFLSTFVVASDVRKKLIFTVITKPLSRWQYLLGRWFGLVLLNAMMLAGAGGAIYAGTCYLHAQEPINQKDRRIVETEIFTARNRVAPDPLDIAPIVNDRIERLKQTGQFATVLEEFKTKTGGDETRAINLMVRDLRQQARQFLQTVGPGEEIKRTFSGIKIAGADVRSEGVVDGMGAGKLPIGRGGRQIRVMDMLIRVDASLLGRLIYRGPVQVNKVVGQVFQRRSASFVARFFGEVLDDPAIARVKKGDKVSLTIEPVIQLSYKLKIATAKGPYSRALRSIWQLQNPDPKRPIYYPAAPRIQEDPVRMASTITVPARVVGPKGRTQVVYVNANHPDFGSKRVVTVRLLNSDMSILYRRGGFNANFLRAILMVLLMMMFLAALGIFTGSFLSFPVACLVCFAVLPFGFMGGFLADALRLPYYPGETVDWGTWLGHYVLKGMQLLLPNFTATSPTNSLVDGMYISWSMLANTALMTLAVRALLLMLLAFWVFQRREIARVQV